MEYVVKVNYAAKIAQETHSWVVIVCPNQSIPLWECRKLLRSTMPKGGYYTGRTMVYDDEGSQLSVVGDSEEFDTPPDKTFMVCFVGWGDVRSKDVKRMERWRERATKVLSFSGVEKEARR